MTSRRFMLDCVAVLETLYDIDADNPGTWVPQTPLYLALDSDLDRWHAVFAALTGAKWVEAEHSRLRITQAGRLKVDEIRTIRSAGEV